MMMMNEQLIKFMEFYDQMDWEGGIEAIIRHGHSGSGFSDLDTALAEAETALDEVFNLIDDICTKYADELEDLRNRRDDE